MIRKADNVITGADKRLMLYFYYSPVSGKNIVRRFTSLTGERVKKEAAFKGFRESGKRMKEASPIASTLYKMVPAEIKQYALYRLLTGEALIMLKQGLDAATTTKTLKQIHIDPLLEPPLKESVRGERIRTGNSDQKPNRLADITRYFPIDSASSRKSPIRRHRQMERLANYLPARDISLPCSASNVSGSETMTLSEQKIPSPDLRISIVANTQNAIGKQVSKFTTKYPDLIYRCRLRECKKLRLYIRSSHFPGVAN